jgi:hypothetical protein
MRRKRNITKTSAYQIHKSRTFLLHRLYMNGFCSVSVRNEMLLLYTDFSIPSPLNDTVYTELP